MQGNINMKIKEITRFYLKDAKYVLSDDYGNRLDLVVNYAKADFSVRIITGGKNNKALVLEAQLIAQHLLNDKAQKNLAERIKENVNNKALETRH